MRHVDAFEITGNLGALLDLIEEGEEVVITREGKPVARLVRATVSRDIEAAREAAREIREMRKGVTLRGLKIKDLINEGRP